MRINVLSEYKAGKTMRAYILKKRLDNMNELIIPSIEKAFSLYNKYEYIVV